MKRISATEVLHLRSAGFSIPEISAAVFASPEKVKSILVAKGAYRRPRVSKLAEFDQEIRALAKAGVPDRKIALFLRATHAIAASQQVVNAYIKKQGVRNG